MPEWIRVTDDVKPRREYSVIASTVDPEVHKVLDKPATEADGSPLPTKYAPESLAGSSGQKATTTKETS